MNAKVICSSWVLSAVMDWFLLMLEDGGVLASFTEREKWKRSAFTGQQVVQIIWKMKTDFKQGKVYVLVSSFIDLDMDFSECGVVIMQGGRFY